MTAAEARTGTRARRLRTIALVVFALIAGTAVNRLTPEPVRSQQPFLLSGSVGSPVAARTFTLTALDSRTGPELAGDEFGSGPPVLDTAGVWVMVKVRVESLREPTRIAYAALVDEQGRTFRSTFRTTQNLVDRTLQPQLPVEGEIVFEVPADALGRMRLRASPGGLDRRLDAMTDIALDVTPPPDGLFPLVPEQTRLVTP